MKKVIKRKRTKKEVSKKEVSNIDKLKSFITNDKTLLAILIILAIVVVVLFVKILNLRKVRENNPNSNIIIPILEKNQNIPFNIDAYKLENGDDEYIIKITNYSGNKKAKEDINYKIEISNYSNSEISVTKDDDNKNLIDGDKPIEGTMKKDSQEATYYHVKVTENKGIKEKELIGVRITS